MFTLLAIIACADAPTPDPVPEPPAAVDARPTTPPAGTIGGAPILERPVVIGAISAEVVEAGITAKREAIDRCVAEARVETPDLSGKVLVKFTITNDGAVSKPVTRSTSLRHPDAEACLHEQLTQISFPALESGVAFVTYPFTFAAL